MVLLTAPSICNILQTMLEKPKSLRRDTKVLTLLALRVTKALLITLKEEYDVSQGRLLDQAVEELAIRLIGKRRVQKLKIDLRDSKNKELLTREPRRAKAKRPNRA